MTTNRPLGERFTSIYREQGPRVANSDRLRRRLAHKFHDALDEYEVIKSIRAETGWSIASSGTAAWWLQFFQGLEQDEFLDFLTIAVHSLAVRGDPNDAINLVKFVRRCLDEENISFEMDEAGGLHYRVDEAFQNSRSASLAALDKPDQVAARMAFEEANRALTGHPSDTLLAVRRAFDAVENLFKIRFGTARLGMAEIRTALQTIGDASGSRAGDAARRLNAAFGEWTNACHQYRHAPGEADPGPPPRWLATALVDGASTYIRYLTEDA